MIFKVENTYLKTIIWQNLKETAIQCTIIHALPQTAEDSHIRIARLIATPPEKNYYIASLLSIQLIKKKKSVIHTSVKKNLQFAEYLIPL